MAGLVLSDRLEQLPRNTGPLEEYMWSRREIENYLCQPETLLGYAHNFDATGLPLFDGADEKRANREAAMQECIEDFVPRIALKDRTDAWWNDTKMSDDFLDRLFPAFFKKIGLPNLMRKTDYHILARFVPLEQISPEVGKMLDAIHATATKAIPVV